VHLIYDTTKASIVKDLIDQICETCHFLQCELRINNETNLKKLIKESDAVVIFSAGVLSDKMKREYEMAKEEKKIILPVTINSMFKSQDFKTIEINEPFKLDLNRSSLDKLNAFFSRSVQKGKFYYNNNISVDFELIESGHKSGHIRSIEYISNYEYLVNYISSDYEMIEIYNIETAIIMSIRQSPRNTFHITSWIHHLNQVLVTEGKKMYLFDKNAHCLRTINLEVNDTRFIMRANIFYNKYSRKTVVTSLLDNVLYLFEYNENFNRIMFLPKIIDYSFCQIINGYLYQHDKSFIYIYDFSLKLVASISHPFRGSENHIKIISDTKKISKYVFIKSEYPHIIHILDTNSYSFVGIIDFKISIQEIISICNEKIILLDTKRITRVYKIGLRKKILEKIIDSKYICQINPLKPHLFKHIALWTVSLFRLHF
jgi:hypothetical protein